MAKEEKVEKKKKRKLRWQVKLFIIILIIIIYAFIIGPKGIFVKEYKITTSKISTAMDGLKILHISDLHYGSTMNKNDVKKIVTKANETKPDIVVFSGDLINEKYEITESEKEFLKKELSKINAELGKYYVVGEEDFEDATSILNLSGFINLDNNPQSVYGSDNKPILLIDKNGSKTYFENNDNVPSFKILVIHNPDDFDEVKEHNFDMALAGHTHNGQVNIIKIKDLIIKSKYNKSYQKVGNTKLFINPGMGTSKINIRLFNHPTMYLYRINKASTN